MTMTRKVTFFLVGKKMDRRFKGLSFARSGIHNETKRKVIIHGRRGTERVAYQWISPPWNQDFWKLDQLEDVDFFFSEIGPLFLLLSLSVPHLNGRWFEHQGSRCRDNWWTHNLGGAHSDVFLSGSLCRIVGSWTWPSRWNEAQTKKGPIYIGWGCCFFIKVPVFEQTDDSTF